MPVHSISLPVGLGADVPRAVQCGDGLAGPDEEDHVEVVGADQMGVAGADEGGRGEETVDARNVDLTPRAVGIADRTHDPDGGRRSA